MRDACLRHDELEPLSRHPVALKARASGTTADMRLLRMQRQTSSVHPRPDQIEGGIGLLAAPGEDHKIVRIPHVVSETRLRVRP